LNDASGSCHSGGSRHSRSADVAATLGGDVATIEKAANRQIVQPGVIEVFTRGVHRAEVLERDGSNELRSSHG
jgi:hypothetical protein